MFQAKHSAVKINNLVVGGHALSRLRNQPHKYTDGVCDACGLRHVCLGWSDGLSYLTNGVASGNLMGSVDNSFLEITSILSFKLNEDYQSTREESYQCVTYF